MAQTFNTGLKDVAAHYLHLLHAKVTTSTIQQDLEENAYYPSLLSLSDTFSKYKINNGAYEVDKESFDLLEAPFLAYVHMPKEGKDFVLVTKVEAGTIYFLHKGKKTRSLSKEAFLKRFRNVVWLAEANEQSGQTEYLTKQKEERRQKEKNLVLYLLLAILVGVAAWWNLDSANFVSFTSIVLLKLAGTAVAIMLLIYELDKNNAFVAKICNANSHTDCDAVLNSKASKIMGISWAEIGFFYFTSTALFLLFPLPAYAEKIAILAPAGILAATYIPFSIYYQWRVVKQWCPLCLTVQAVLFLELIWSISAVWSASPSFFGNTVLSGAGYFLFCLLLVGVAWYGIKPLLRKAHDGRLFSAAYKRLQYNPEIFNAFLLQQPKAPDGWEELSVGLGNPDAETTILKICMPYCNPCSKAHAALEEILRRNDNVQLKVIFRCRKEDDRGTAVARHLLAVAAKGGRQLAQQAWDDWYLAEQKQYEDLAAKYPMNGELKEQDTTIEAMGKWCEEAEIPGTPTIYINGYRLPENYEIAELKNFL